MKTILVTEQAPAWSALELEADIVNAHDYLSNYEKFAKEKLRVVNLCSGYHYQSIGYYVSLLAEARGQRAFPSVMHTQEFNKLSAKDMLESELDEEIQHSLGKIKSDEFQLSLYFGKNLAHQHERLARKIHSLLPLPLFRVYFYYKKKWRIKKIISLSITDMPTSHLPFLIESAKQFFSKKRFSAARKKFLFHDLAILYNPKEKTAPSDMGALKKFIQAGNDIGIRVELITKDDYKTLNEFDALFIRETTAVNHHTYRFACKAMSEGLVVVDDPHSILKCCNKVYLAETLRGNQISSPATQIISKQNWRDIIKTLQFPCVLKQPDSAFSKGVIKVASKEEAAQACTEFLKHSELIISQVFMPTEFDWRIGVFDDKPLFACRYYMAENHWQIYNWSLDEECPAGNFNCVSLEKVPETVLSTALKACKLIGNGLYGVDLKEKDGRVYVIEVNDNPSIDAGVEDQLVGDTLYHNIMSVFLNRIHKARGYVK